MSNIDELSKGHQYGVFIDDTGSPGLSSTSQLHPDRKTWVAVIIPPHQIPEVLDQIPKAIDGLQEITGATEFHFSDIYQGRNEFERVDYSARMKLFEFMAYIFQIYKFPILVQTFDPNTFKEIKRKGLPDQMAGDFNLSKINDTALMFLLIRAKWFLKQRSGVGKVFVDEGYRKAGGAIRLPSFQGVFDDGLVHFDRSNNILPLQLADFAAFVLNREQFILSKQYQTDKDIEFTKLIESIDLQFQNISRKNIVFKKAGDNWEINLQH